MVEFTPAERQFYDALHEKSLNLFEGFIQAGTENKSWLAIFSLLNRLRQTCDHVALTVRAHLDEEDWTTNIFQAGGEENAEASTAKKGNVKAVIDQKVRLIKFSYCSKLLVRLYLKLSFVFNSFWRTGWGSSGTCKPSRKRRNLLGMITPPR
jgi:SNF2 family DNA or RNA helicase